MLSKCYVTLVTLSNRLPQCLLSRSVQYNSEELKASTATAGKNQRGNSSR
ncbi:unnamed protein product [Larinioides sclopetarius]|uniref:Uncharacterized protein n=1 Tax=Larinioides sclopetarius TaxID=280406 RepID=A0AAV1ZIT7_9ARAC